MEPEPTATAEPPAPPTATPKPTKKTKKPQPPPPTATPEPPVPGPTDTPAVSLGERAGGPAPQQAASVTAEALHTAGYSESGGDLTPMILLAAGLTLTGLCVAFVLLRVKEEGSA